MSGKPNYPVAPQRPVKNVYHGVEIEDPYQWMEDQDHPDLTDWIDSQNELFNQYISSSEVVDKLKKRIEESQNYEKYGCPSRHGSKYYFYYNSGLQNQYVLYVKDKITDSLQESKVFFDPNLLSEDGTSSVSAQKFSKNATYFAYGVSEKGSDSYTINVMLVDSGKKLEDSIPNIKYSGIAWTHDELGFFYSRFPTDEEKKASSKETYHKIYYHRLGESEDKMVFEYPEDADTLVNAQVSDDGKYLLITLSKDCNPTNRLYICDLTQGNGYDSPLVVNKIVDNEDSLFDYITNEGTEFYFLNNLNSPRNRIIKLDLLHPEEIIEVVPQSKDVLSCAMVVDNDKLILAYMKDVKEILQIFNLKGEFLEEIELPGIGSIGSISCKKEYNFFTYSFTSFTYPGSIFYYSFETRKSVLLNSPHIEGFDPLNFKVEQHFYKSSDGTSIPIFIVYPAGLQRDGNNLTVLYGYGGFNISLTPSFSSTRIVVMQAFNAVYAIPNIRGGGEYGVEWHQAATKLKKQKSYDDFIAAAEFLIAEKFTSPSKISIMGGSNGGLLVSVCANQRPDLFASVVSQVPVADMFRFHLFTIGKLWVSDYGSVDDADEFKNLLAIDPIRNIKANTPYPAVLITTADHDDRVVPAHSFKLIAHLQQILGSSPHQINPLLIRVDKKSGHGHGKPMSKIIQEAAESYSFIALSTNTSLSSNFD